MRCSSAHINNLALSNCLVHSLQMFQFRVTHSCTCVAINKRKKEAINTLVDKVIILQNHAWNNFYSRNNFDRKYMASRRHDYNVAWSIQTALWTLCLYIQQYTVLQYMLFFAHLLQNENQACLELNGSTGYDLLIKKSIFCNNKKYTWRQKLMNTGAFAASRLRGKWPLILAFKRVHIFTKFNELGLKDLLLLTNCQLFISLLTHYNIQIAFSLDL